MPVKPVHRKLLSPWSTSVALVILAGSLVLPEQGMGIPLCWLKALTGVPCPGCGLTRSVTHISHLHFGDALRDHPFGFPVYLLSLALVTALVWPAGRRRMARFLAEREAAAQRVYWGIVGSFIFFGACRMAVAFFAPELVAHL